MAFIDDCRLLAFVLGLGCATVPPVAAQSSAPAAEAPDSRSGWRAFDAGISLSPLFIAYIDVPPQPAAGGWVTWGAGKFRVQIDYVHNRRRYVTYPGYYEEREGQEIVVQRAYLDTHVEQVTGASLYWRLSERAPFSTHLLLGLAYWNLADRRCVARGEPVVRLPPRAHDPNELLFRVEFAEGEERRCADRPAIRFQRITPQVGAGFDVPIGSRVFGRAQLRLFLLEVRIGVGVRF